MKKSRLLGAVCGCLLIPIYANASTLISDNFQRTGISEQTIAPFNDDNGVQTLNAYSDFVEVIVSGTGNSLSTAINDAFYGVYGGVGCVTEGVPVQSTCLFPPTYQLAVASELTAFETTGASDVENFITFIGSVGFVTSGTLPDYDPLNHTYHFVIDLALLNVNSSSLLTFGVTDDYYTDNGGSFTIDIYQIRAIPLPPALWLFGSGLLGLVGISRKKRK